MLNASSKVHDRKSDDLPINSRVAIAIVDDPYSAIGEKIEVLRSTRDDILARLRAVRAVDECQFLAGRLWEAAFEKAQIGGVGAIDPTKEAVDGGKMREALTDGQIKAFKLLQDARSELGTFGYGLIMDILGHRMTITRSAERRNCFSTGDQRYISFRFKSCLDDLAVLWQLAGK